MKLSPVDIMEGEGGLRKSTIEEAFKEACASVWEHRTSEEYEPVRMQLYGLFKVATEGKCESAKPDVGLGMENPRKKWEAWMRASTFSKEEAMQQYVTTALSVVKRRGDAAATNAVAIGNDQDDGVGDDAVAAGVSGVRVDAGEREAAGSTATGEGKRVEHDMTADEELIARLKAETKILETYLTNIQDEIDMATGNLGNAECNMSGWLSKWRDREVYLWGSPKWEPRYFVLDGVSLTLACYKTEQSIEAESVLSLKRCVLREEGSKQGKPAGHGKPVPVYHVFGLYLEGALERGPDAGVLMRLSTDDEEVADRWKSVLRKACVVEDDSEDWSVEGADISAPDDGTRNPSVASEETLRQPMATFAVPPMGPVTGLPPGGPLLRKGSWDIAGTGMNGSLQSLRSLSQRIHLDRSGHGGFEAREKGAGVRGSAAEDAPRVTHQDSHRGSSSHSKREPKKFDPRGYPASRPMHKEAKPSVLSEDASAQNYRGLLNLMAILLLVTNSRLIAANLRNYGVLVSLPRLTSFDFFADTPRLTGTLALVLHVLAALGVEKLAMPRPGNEKGMLGGTEAPVLILHGLNLTVCLCAAVCITWVTEGSPVLGFAYLFTAVILWMKLISYAHANRDLRLAWRAKASAAKSKGDGLSQELGKGDGDGDGGAGGKHQQQNDGLVRPSRAGSSSSFASLSRRNTIVGGGGGGGGAVVGSNTTGNSYPANINLRNMVYFWFAPTLCYQLDYPLSEQIRYRYVLSLVVRLIILGGAMSVITDQYILPTVHDFASSDPAANWLISLEQLLTLAVPNTYVWLLGFYAFFHVTLNLLAELLLFGDRVFYRDWWNANTIESYWRLWNLPVHYWMARHVYFPALRAGLSKNQASALCFLLSAVFHELLVSVPFHMVKFYAFLGMIGNVPLVPLTKSLSVIWGNDQQVGNWIFWVLFCVVGQPMSLLLYYRDYCGQHSCSNPFLNY